MATPLAQVGKAVLNRRTLARRAIGDPAWLEAIITGLGAETARIKYGCAKALRVVSEDRPGEFSGVHRRFQVKGEAKGVLVVDDYGHHPTEVRATLAAAKAALGRRVVCVFQPPRYTRTKHLLEEFCTAFNQADKVIILDIYAAGEQPLTGVSGQAVYEGIRNYGHKDAAYIGREQAIEHLAGTLRKGDLLLTLGAGDVYGNWAKRYSRRSRSEVRTRTGRDKAERTPEKPHLLPYRRSC